MRSSDLTINRNRSHAADVMPSASGLQSACSPGWSPFPASVASAAPHADQPTAPALSLRNRIARFLDRPVYRFPARLQAIVDAHSVPAIIVQLAGTLLILAAVPSNLARAIALPAWWFVTFGSLAVHELVCFVVGSLLFTVMDIMTVRRGAFAFTSPDLFGLPYFEFTLWGFYLLHTRRMLAGVPNPEARRFGLALVLAVAFNISFNLARDASTRLLIPGIVLAVALLFFHHISDLAAAGYMIVLGAAVEYTGVWSGLWTYPERHVDGVPAWFIPMWAGVGFFVNRLFPSDLVDVLRSDSRAEFGKTDILLVNSFNPRRRSLSDVFLDNGLAILRTHLKSHGFRVEIEDRSGVGQLEKFSPWWITRPLRRMTLRLLAAREAGKSPRFLKLVFVGLQYALDAVHAIRSRFYINRIANHVARRRIPVVGIKVWYGRSFVWSKRLVAALKERCPEVITIAGGPHPNLYNHDGAILKHSNFDLAVYSEGERTLAAIMSGVRQGRDRAERLEMIRAMNLPNLIWRSGDRVVVNEQERPNPDTKPFPVYGDMTAARVKVHTLVDGLGCDYNRCTFCPHKNIYRGYRKRSVTTVVDEMERMIREGIAIFRFASGDTPRCHALAMADEIMARGLKVEFSMFHRASRGARAKFDQLVADYRAIIRAGLRAVFMGLECGDDRTNQEILGKNLIAEDVIWSIRALQEARELERARVDIALSMIHPVPTLAGADWENVFTRTRDAVLEARPDSALVTPPCVFPGTDWFDHPEKYGFRLGENYVERLMNYEYVLYQPTDLWPASEYSLNGHGAREILVETMRLRATFEKAGIPTDMGDENFLILQAGEEDPVAFKRETLADILSCDYRYSHALYAALNGKSAVLAGLNLPERLEISEPLKKLPVVAPEIVKEDVFA